jgi:5-methylcytosine-specific restriction endonuclease McrA
MKLPNFLFFGPLNSLKARMGIPLEKLGSLRSVTIGVTRLSIQEAKKLEEEGLEVDIEDVEFLSDGTIAYKDRRVLLYIRDVSFGGSSEKQANDPRFHIAACKMLHRMKSIGRFEQRYVVSTRIDGNFKLHYVQAGLKLDKKLDVCQYCLGKLRYRNFDYGLMKRPQRKAIVNGFSISEFFEKYPRALHGAVPKHDDVTAPTNQYSADFFEISQSYRAKVDWRCEECRIVLDSPDTRRYLHVHHLDGAKNNNAEQNLKALCVLCHSKQPMHGHMKHTASYIEFVRVLQQRPDFERRL